MKVIFFRKRENDRADARETRPLIHFVTITLLVLAAVAASIVLTPDEPAAPVAGASHGNAGNTAAGSDVDPNSRPGEPSAKAAQPPFDYFPAQFPTPSGDTPEQAPTF